MPQLNLQSMHDYLSRSIASLNRNKLNGLLAEIAFRNQLIQWGFADRVSPGGWIVRTKGPGLFGRHTVVFFPETVQPDTDYPLGRQVLPDQALHTICATFHQLGIQSYYCIADVASDNDSNSVTWRATQLGIPNPSGFNSFPACIQGFTTRSRSYNWLRYSTVTSQIPDLAIPDEFSKEHARIAFFNQMQAEVSDVDGIFWGQTHTYPVEIKEKTAADSPDMGEYFGLDVGPFVKLAFFAAKRGQMHSLFVVHEIDDEITRGHVEWWYVPFDQLAQFASWNFRAGGRGMGGGRSATVRIPKAQFSRLDIAALQQL